VIAHLPQADPAAADLVMFYQMTLNKRVYQGKRLLSPASVESMSRNP